MCPKSFFYAPVLLLTFILVSCGAGSGPETTAADVQTPVEVCNINHEPISEYIDLNATATFLLKNVVKANANGYLTSVKISMGQPVNKGQLLFTIKTKEAVSIGNTLSNLDSSFKFTGVNSLRASENGFVSQLDHQQGDYVQDGEALATISDNSSFAFIMSLPYELRSFIEGKKNVIITLPDGMELTGTIASLMPTVDSLSQAQNILIKVPGGHAIPENLVGKVRIIKQQKQVVTSVPRSAVLTDESQSSFWIMKMSGAHTVLKVPVKKGMETKDRIEILDPVLTDADRILISGNYGLEDSASVKVVKTIP